MDVIATYATALILIAGAALVLFAVVMG